MKENSENRISGMLEEAIQKIQEHNISAALEKLLELVELDRENVKAINLIASCYYVLGEFERAEACWEKVIQIDSLNKIAASRLNSLRTPSFQFWIKRYKDVLTDVENRDYQGAKNKLRQLLEENDGFVSIYQLLGLCYMVESDKKKATQVWRKGLELDVSNPVLAKYLREASKSNTDLASQDKMIKPDNRKGSTTKRGNLVWVIAGVLCLALCLQIGISVKNTRSSNKMINDMQVKIQQLSQKVNNAEEVVPAASTVDNQSPKEITGKNDNEMMMAGSDYDTSTEEYYYNTGYQAYVDKDFKTAVSNLGVVVAMQTHSYLNREALYFLARTYYLQEDYANAEKSYLKYLQEFPDSNYYDDSLFYLGCVYYRTGKSENAAAMFKQLEELKPDSGYASTELFKKVMGEEQSG